MGKIDENKIQKKQRLMETSFQLFLEKGISRTTISDIAAQAGVAKGTIYLYFKDKYDLQEKLIAHKAKQLIQHALANSFYETKADADEKVIAIIDDILDELQKDKKLLKFINKNLSWGILRRALSRSELDPIPIFAGILNVPADDPSIEVVIYMIIELVSSTAHNIILENDPVPFKDFKPWLYMSILAIIHECLGAAQESSAT